jgi:hypothetical protein
MTSSDTPARAQAGLRFAPADLVHQAIWAWLLVHHTISHLITRPPY